MEIFITSHKNPIIIIFNDFFSLIILKNITIKSKLRLNSNSRDKICIFNFNNFKKILFWHD